MSTPRSSRWSTVLLTLGAIGLFLTGITGWLNAAVVNGQNFAGLVNEVRQDEAVKTQIGQTVATAALDAQPDLIAVEPAIAAGAAAIAGSPLLDSVFTPAIREFHSALTQEGSDSAVLKLADLGATATTALEKFVPQAADVIPDNLNVTLAEVGGQGGIAMQIIPVVQTMTTLAWVVPLVALILIGLGIWLAPRRRLALVRLGWSLLVVAGFLGLVVLGLNAAGLVIDDSTLQGAVISAALAIFSEPLSLRFIAMGVVGGLLVASAGALLPQVDVGDHARSVVGIATRRPEATGWAVARALLVIAVGLLIVLFPTISSQVVAVVAGLVVLFYGVTELDIIAERSRAEDEKAKAAARGAGGTEPTPATLGGPLADPCRSLCGGAAGPRSPDHPGEPPAGRRPAERLGGEHDGLQRLRRPVRRALRPGRHPRVAQLHVDRGRHLVPCRAAEGHGRVTRRRHPGAARGHLVRRAHR